MKTTWTGPSQRLRSRIVVFHWSTLGVDSLPRFFQMSQWRHRALHRSVNRIAIAVGRQWEARRPPANVRSR